MWCFKVLLPCYVTEYRFTPYSSTIVSKVIFICKSQWRNRCIDGTRLWFKVVSNQVKPNTYRASKRKTQSRWTSSQNSDPSTGICQHRVGYMMADIIISLLWHTYGVTVVFSHTFIMSSSPHSSVSCLRIWILFGMCKRICTNSFIGIISINRE